MEDALVIVGSTGLRVDATEPVRLNYGIDDYRQWAPALRAHELPVFPADGDTAHGAFVSFVVDLKEADCQMGSGASSLKAEAEAESGFT